MLLFNLTSQHYFVNIFTKNLSKIKIKVCFMKSIERAVESTIKPFLYLIRKPRNNQKQSGNSIVGHPVVEYGTIYKALKHHFSCVREGVKKKINYFDGKFHEGGTPPPFVENNFDFSRIFSQNFLLLYFMFWTICSTFFHLENINYFSGGGVPPPLCGKFHQNNFF